MNKKFLSICLVLSMLFLQSFSAFAAEPNSSNDIIEDTIIEQALALEQSANIEGKNFVAVLLNQGESEKDTFFGNSIVTEQAIQAVSVQDDLVEVITIFPYKILPNGEMVNSFEYMPTQTTRNSTVPTTFVDTTITVVTSYAHYYSENNAQNFYRHGGIEVYWNSDNSTAKVSNMYVIYDSAGDLYKYPECLTESLSSTLIQEDYFIRSTVDQDNPVENQSYFDANHTMSRSNVLLCASYFDHGGLIYLKLTYSVNGNSYTHDRSYYVYTA